MKKNMGYFDKFSRIIIGLSILMFTIGGTITGTWFWIWNVIAGIMILTALINFCPLYVPFGINTAKSKNETEK